MKNVALILSDMSFSRSEPKFRQSVDNIAGWLNAQETPMKLSMFCHPDDHNKIVDLLRAQVSNSNVSFPDFDDSGQEIK